MAKLTRQERENIALKAHYFYVLVFFLSPALPIFIGDLELSKLFSIFSLIISLNFFFQAYIGLRYKALVIGRIKLFPESSFDKDAVNGSYFLILLGTTALAFSVYLFITRDASLVHYLFEKS